MKAITYHRYGSPEVIGIEEVATPTPAEGQILVRVRASVVTPADGAARKGQPLLIRFMAGLRRPPTPWADRVRSRLAGLVISSPM